MSELMIRRNRGAAVPRYQVVEKTEKASDGQRVASQTGLTAEKGLERLLTRVSQVEGQIRESHRTLLAGETALAEVRESLDRIGELLQGDTGEFELAALRAEVERLREDIDRMLGSASYGGQRLFLEGEETGAPPQDAVSGEAASGQKAVQALPDWLVRSLTQNARTPEELLRALGLDKNASGSELLAAVMKYPLNGNPTVDYLAALYLGAVIAGGASPRAVSPEDALAGLRQLLERVAEGVALDKAVFQLTNGAFTGMADFQSQFTGGVALELREFLMDLLLSGGGSAYLDGASLLTLLGGDEEMKLELMMGLLEAAQSAGSAGERQPPAVETASLATATGQSSNVQGFEAQSLGVHNSVLTLEGTEVLGRDLSGVTYDEATRTLTVGGTGDVMVRGTGEGLGSVVLTGSGTVTLQNVRAPLFEAAAPETRVLSAGENDLSEVRLGQNVRLSLGGGGLLRIAALHGGKNAVLRQTDGAVTVTGADPLALPVQLDGPASFAALGDHVSNLAGEPLSPFDIVWKTLLPGWSCITAMEVDGRQARMFLPGGTHPEAARLWLKQGDPSHGSPVHTAIIRGKDAFGRPKTRYAYLHWSRRSWGFEEISMYPNPFVVTGGEEERDWAYEEATQTLLLLSDQVTALSGGMGIDAGQAPFSGRIALADGIGPVTLTLDGTVCRVEEGRAFDLGRENEVTLWLRSGTENRFASGAGCAGISLGEGSSLQVDCPDARQSGRNPDGRLTASGSGGGAGIGRDCGGGRDQTSRIVIRGGRVTASGGGGGAGIGAGKSGWMGTVTLLGGTVSASSGSGGGAGIGGGRNGPVGDIQIRGGSVCAEAVDHAAAIGAGMEGPCGDILITGTARIVKARGGDPGADIGSCLFGGCGEVRISGGADIGKAGLSTQSGVPLRMGGDTMTLPQFRLSAKALGLDKLDLSTREAIRSAQALLEADRRWIERIQAAYGVFYRRLEQSAGGLENVQRYLDAAEGRLRDSSKAGTLLQDTRRSLAQPSSQAMRTHGGGEAEDVELLFR